MFNLDLLKMLKNTSSKQIHVWKQPKKGGQAVDSYPEKSPEAAFKAYTKDKSSLYFASSLSFDNLFMKHLNMQLGQNFAGYYPSANDVTTMDQMGEIETFVSRAGNYTDWHTDFQENFTMQLKGSKTWKLLRSGL